MAATYRITEHGDIIDFSTLAEAEAALLACGLGVTLRVTGRGRYDDPHVTDRIVDQDGDLAGYVVEEVR